MNERYDAALLHVYGYKEEKCPPDSPERPHIRTRLVIAAARELYKRGQVDHFVFSGGTALSKVDPMSVLAAEDLVRKIHLDQEDVVSNASAAVTTSEELRTLKNESKDNGWTSSVSIGWGLHTDRIRILSRKRLDKNVRHNVLSAEEILATCPDERDAKRYARIIDAIHNSESEKRWQKYEKRLTTIIGLPFAAELMDFVAKFYRPKAD